jgi:hypothetical protein
VPREGQLAATGTNNQQTPINFVTMDTATQQKLPFQPISQKQPGSNSDYWTPKFSTKKWCVIVRLVGSFGLPCTI